jgi:hypothetical protein
VRDEQLARAGERLRAAFAAEEGMPDEDAEPGHLQAHGRWRPPDHARRARHRSRIDRGDERPKQLEGEILHEGTSRLHHIDERRSP